MASTSSTHHHAADSANQTPVPVLRVMRLQAAQIHASSSGSLLLPESFGTIHIGEVFRAYVGILNPTYSKNIDQLLEDGNLPKHDKIRRLCVHAQLQTPSKRYNLVTNFEEGVDLQHSIDFILAQKLDELGQHILRLELVYDAYIQNRLVAQYNNNNNGEEIDNQQDRKTLRKFYRFNVAQPLQIKTSTTRGGGEGCVFAEVVIENIGEKDATNVYTISDIVFVPPFGLSAERIGANYPHMSMNQPVSNFQNNSTSSDMNNPMGMHSGSPLISRKSITQRRTAAQLYDECDLLGPNTKKSYIFAVKASSQDAVLRGIACGDVLGKVVVSWTKAMGENGQIESQPIVCPSSQTNIASSSFVVHGSGLSVDVAASAANRVMDAAAGNTQATLKQPLSLDQMLPVTVEPIDPPASMTLFTPIDIQLIIVNHSDKPMDLQLQMRLSEMKGIVVCGSSFKNIGEIRACGGSHFCTLKVMPILAGLFKVDGCVIIDTVCGREVLQPPLFHALVERGLLPCIQ